MTNYAGNAGLDLDDNRGITEIFPTDSKVGLARDVLALQMLANWHRSTSDSRALQSALAQSLSHLRLAVCDKTQDVQDNIIAAALMLQTKDYATAFVGMREASHLHLDGAVALVEKRGVKNFKTRTSRHLLACVRHGCLRKALLGAGRIDPHSELWKTPIPPFELGDGILDPLAYEVVLLRNAFSDLEDSHAQAPSKTASQGLGDVTSIGRKLEAKLLCWASQQPAYLQPVLVSDPSQIHSSIAREGIFRGTCEVHYTIESARIWATYRHLRLSLYEVMIGCECLQQGAFSPKEFKELCGRASEVFDGLCFSIPYFLGNKRGGNHISDFAETDKLQFPRLKPTAVMQLIELARQEGAMPQPSRQEHVRQAGALCGWPLFRTLLLALRLLRSEVYCSTDLARARNQQQYLQQQFQRLVALFDLRRN